MRSCEFWKSSLIENAFDLNISDPIKLQEKAKQEVSDDKLKQSIVIVTKIDDLIRPIEEYFDLALLKYLHTVQVRMKKNLFKNLLKVSYHIL